MTQYFVDTFNLEGIQNFLKLLMKKFERLEIQRFFLSGSGHFFAKCNRPETWKSIQTVELKPRTSRSVINAMPGQAPEPIPNSIFIINFFRLKAYS